VIWVSGPQQTDTLIDRLNGRRKSERAREREREKRRKRERRVRRKRLHCKKTTQTVIAGRQQVQWAGVYPGRPALPYLAPALPVTTDRQTPLLLLYIR